MRRHEIGMRPGFQHDLEEIAGIETEDRPAVGGDVADSSEPRRHAIDSLEIRRIDQMMDFAGAVALLVDGGNLDLEHEPHRSAARGRQGLSRRLGDVVAQAKEAAFGGNELLLELGAPGGMGEIPGTDDADALAAGPGGEMLEIEVPAGGTRMLRVNVQVRVESHARRAPSSEPRRCSDRNPWEAWSALSLIRGRTERPPVDSCRGGGTTLHPCWASCPNFIHRRHAASLGSR